MAAMPSVAGRTPPNLWPRAATDDEVRGLIDSHLDRLEQHVSAALAVHVGGLQSSNAMYCTVGSIE